MPMYGPATFQCAVCRNKQVVSIRVFGKNVTLEELLQAGETLVLRAGKNGRVVLEFQCANGHRFAQVFELKNGVTMVSEEHLSGPIRRLEAE